MTSALLLALVVAADGQYSLGPKPRAEVKRVVTVAPSLTETVIALGAVERLVGVSRFDEDPAVATVVRVGGFNDPSVEAIVALKPDLVIVQRGPGNQKPIERLAALGFSVLALPLTSVSDVLEAITTIGRVLKRDDAAVRVVNDFKATQAKVRARVSTHPTVLLVYGFSPLVVAGPGSFAHELLGDCGAKNAADTAPTAYPTYSLERAVKLAPDVIIDAADATDSDRSKVMALGPLKQARWVTLPNKDLLHPGPALGRGLVQLCELLASPHDAGATPHEVFDPHRLQRE